MARMADILENILSVHDDWMEGSDTELCSPPTAGSVSNEPI